MCSSLCIFSSSFTYKLHNVWLGTAPAPRRGGHSGKRGPAMKPPLARALPGEARGASQPLKWAKWQGQARHQPGGSAVPADVRAGSRCGTRTEAQPGWEGSSHRPLLFRHEFLSWHSCPQALYICLIPISLLSFKSTSLSGVITGQFSPHARFRYCMYYLYVDLGDIVSQFPAR